MKPLELLVVGTGRCGTVFLARLLTTLGIPCGHESIFSFSGLGIAEQVLKGGRRPRLSQVSTYNILRQRSVPKWVDVGQIVAESSYLAAPFLSDPLIKDVPVVHIVRHPLLVISSFVKDFQYFRQRRKRVAWENFIYSHLPDLWDLRPPIEVACGFYVGWNEMIEKACVGKGRRYLHHRIEDMPSPEFFQFINKEPHTDMFSNSAVNTNKRRKANFTVEDIPDGDIKDKFLEMMDKYGYKPFRQPRLL